MNNTNRHRSKLKFAGTIALAWIVGSGVSVLSMMASAAPNARSPADVVALPVGSSVIKLDRTGRTRVGKASFYAERYAGKTMADGTPMHLYSNNAASTTLPLGTTAKVTNLDTGRSTWVTIRDRGPYVKGRIIDLSPTTARQIGLSRRQGLAAVEVTPLTIPMADGSIKATSVRLASTVD